MADAPHPAAIERAVSEAMRLLAELPDGDERLKVDSLEGETAFFSILDQLAEAALADTMLAEAAHARMQRIERRAVRRREIIRQMLEVAGLAKVERPLFTASISHRAKAIVTDQAALPAELMRTAPDMHAVAKALKAGPIPGAEMSNAAAVLTLRSN